MTWSLDDRQKDRGFRQSWDGGANRLQLWHQKARLSVVMDQGQLEALIKHVSARQTFQVRHLTFKPISGRAFEVTDRSGTRILLPDRLMAAVRLDPPASLGPKRSKRSARKPRSPLAQALKARSLRAEDVAKACGLPVVTVRAVIKGKVQDPRVVAAALELVGAGEGQALRA